MHCHHDMISLRCRDHAFLGIRGEPRVPDDIVILGVCPGVKQSWHRRYEAIVPCVLQRPPQCVGDVRFKDDLRFHPDVSHVHFILSRVLYNIHRHLNYDSKLASKRVS